MPLTSPRAGHTSQSGVATAFCHRTPYVPGSRPGLEHSARREYSLLWLVLLLMFGAFVLDAVAAEKTPEQAEVLLLQFLAVNTTWPGEAFPTPDATLVIGILGENPFGNLTNALIAQPLPVKNGGKATPRRVTIRVYKHVDEVQNCQLLFIPASTEIRNVGAIAEKFKDSTVLTVGDHKLFNKMGGAVKLDPARRGFPYDFSPEALKHSRVTLSPGFFQLAKPGD